MGITQYNVKDVPYPEDISSVDDITQYLVWQLYPYLQDREFKEVEDVSNAIDAHLSGGSGITYSSGVISLGALTGDWDAGGYEIRAETLEADVADGTAPLTITSTTKVSNLNVDQVDGYDLDQDVSVDADVQFGTIESSDGMVRQTGDDASLLLRGSNTEDKGAVIRLFGGNATGYKGDLYLDFGDYTQAVDAGAELVMRVLNNSSATVALKIDKDGAVYIYDTDDSTLRKISYGADDSGGAGYKVLRIPN
jgi:hypothetical protein